MLELDIRKFFHTSWSQAFQSALTACNRLDCIILFPSGVYRFDPEKEMTQFACISNHNSATEHPFALILDGCRQIHLKGEGAELRMNTREIIPFRIGNSRDITIQGFSIDTERPCYAQGTVLHSTDCSFELSVETPDRGESRNGHFFLNGVPYYGAAEMDPETLGLRAGTCLNFAEDYPAEIPVEALDERRFLFHGALKQMPPAGSRLVLRYGRRTTPGIFIEGSDSVKIEDISLWGCAGMGIIAQCSANLTFRRFNTGIRPGSGRMFSICADAIHTVNCRGKIHIEQCSLEHQFDDAINLHGIYFCLKRRTAPNEFIVERGQHAQAGVPLLEPGNRIRLLSPDNLEELGTAEITGCHEISLSEVLIRTATQLDCPPGTAVENLSWRPSEIIIRDNIMRHNNPRGILVTCGGCPIRIENNLIDTPYACISISGDARFWYESGNVDDLLICGNRFRGNYGANNGISKAVIDIRPHISVPRRTPYHGRIRILENVLESESAIFLHAEWIRELEIAGNRQTGTELPRMTIKHCGAC